MTRFLAALVVLEALAIVVLAVAALQHEPPPPASLPEASSTETERQHRTIVPPPGASATVSEVARTEKPDMAEEPSGPPTWSAEDPVGILVYGAITDASAVPIQNATISFRDEKGKYYSDSVRETRNAYSIPGLAPGTYELLVRAPAYDELREEIELHPSPTTLRIDRVLEQAILLRIKVVTDAGRLLRDVVRERKMPDFEIVAVATREPPGEALPMTNLRGHSQRYGLGEYRSNQGISAHLSNQGREAPEEFDGVLQLREPPPVHVSAVYRHVILGTTYVPQLTEDVVIVVPERVLDTSMLEVKACLADAETGAPVVRARLEISDRQSGGLGAMSDEKGCVHIPRQAPGLLVLSIWAKDYEHVRHYLRLHPGTSVDLGTIRLHKAVTVSGRVIAEDGELPQPSVTCRDLDRMTFPQPLDIGTQIGTKPDGTFEIGGAGRGRLVVFVRAEGFARSSVVVDTSGGNVEGLEIRLRRGTEVVLEPDLGPTEHFLAQVTDAAGLIVHAWLLNGNWPVRMTLVPGAYHLNLHDDCELRRTIPFTVAGESLRVPVSSR